MIVSIQHCNADYKPPWLIKLNTFNCALPVQCNVIYLTSAKSTCLGSQVVKGRKSIWYQFELMTQSLHKTTKHYYSLSGSQRWCSPGVGEQETEAAVTRHSTTLHSGQHIARRAVQRCIPFHQFLLRLWSFIAVKSILIQVVCEDYITYLTFGSNYHIYMKYEKIMMEYMNM